VGGAVNQDFVEPGATVGAGFETVEGFPGFEKDVLSEVFGFDAIAAEQANGSAVDFGQPGEGNAFEIISRGCAGVVLWW
jgi:hypothetical protein